MASLALQNVRDILFPYVLDDIFRFAASLANERPMEKSVEYGKAIVDAARKTGIQHFVWS